MLDESLTFERVLVVSGKRKKIEIFGRVPQIFKICKIENSQKELAIQTCYPNYFNTYCQLMCLFCNLKKNIYINIFLHHYSYKSFNMYKVKETKEQINYLNITKDIKM